MTLADVVEQHGPMAQIVRALEITERVGESACGEGRSAGLEERVGFRVHRRIGDGAGRLRARRSRQDHDPR